MTDVFTALTALLTLGLAGLSVRHRQKRPVAAPAAPEDRSGFPSCAGFLVVVLLLIASASVIGHNPWPQPSTLTKESR